MSDQRAVQIGQIRETPASAECYGKAGANGRETLNRRALRNAENVIFK